MASSALFVPRAVCARCRRPQVVCYCAHVTTLTTRTRIVLLQHPRERDVPIGTARMATLCLPEAELHVGIDWSASPALARALSDPARPPALLYPGRGAIDVLASPPPGPVTLVVVDGTWAQTKTIVRDNPILAALPRYAFTAPAPSEYRIRREPDAAYVSTIEALMHVLGALEGDGDRFRALLDPFRAMVDAQLACERGRASSRLRRVRPPRVKPPAIPAWLRARAEHVVCVVGEANAWPYHSAQRAQGVPDELVHWVARRPYTGETFDGVVAPRRPLAPNTMGNVRLDAATLAGGWTKEELLRRWNAFLRADDVLVSWGRYGVALFARTGGALPAHCADLRLLARAVAGGKVGTLAQVASAAGVDATAMARGRAGVRLAESVGLTERYLRAE